jgi:hypothetical protein
MKSRDNAYFVNPIITITEHDDQVDTISIAWTELN